MNGNERCGEPFYAKGLQFECLGCGRCCTGFPGYVYLSEGDVERASKFLRVGPDEFVARHTRVVTVFNERRLSLTEKGNYDCVFWKDGCAIYPARPYQCAAFPFWKRHLVSRREWDKTTSLCGGIDRGRVYPRSEIDRLVREVPLYDIERFALRVR
jgi:Fe-S-cluster containining protein